MAIKDLQARLKELTEHPITLAVLGDLDTLQDRLRELSEVRAAFDAAGPGGMNG